MVVREYNRSSWIRPENLGRERSSRKINRYPLVRSSQQRKYDRIALSKINLLSRRLVCKYRHFVFFFRLVKPRLLFRFQKRSRSNGLVDLKLPPGTVLRSAHKVPVSRARLLFPVYQTRRSRSPSVSLGFAITALVAFTSSTGATAAGVSSQLKRKSGLDIASQYCLATSIGTASGNRSRQHFLNAFVVRRHGHGLRPGYALNGFHV